MQGYFKSVRRGRRVLLVGVVCNSVKCARGARFDRLAKTGPEGAGSHANRGQKSAAQIYAAVGSSKENRQRRLLTNIGLTMECPSQAGKLVRGIG